MKDELQRKLFVLVVNNVPELSLSTPWEMGSGPVGAAVQAWTPGGDTVAVGKHPVITGLF